MKSGREGVGRKTQSDARGSETNIETRRKKHERRTWGGEQWGEKEIKKNKKR